MQTAREIPDNMQILKIPIVINRVTRASNSIITYFMTNICNERVAYAVG